MKKTFKIAGMHCISCETLLEKECQNIAGIKSCKASHRQSTLEIETANKKDISPKIEKIIEKCGYKIGTQKNPIKLQDWLQIGFIFIALLFIIFLLSKFEIAKFFPDISQDISLAVALLLGVIASVSTCLALTGGIVMSFSSNYSIQKNTLFNRALPQIYFHLGRVGGFALLGGLLGILGSTFQYSISFTGYLTILVAVVMFYIGLQILNLVPSITRLGFHLPKQLSASIYNLQTKKHPLIPLTIGILTFFLPCGFTQSMQLAAVASGSFWTGAMIMTFFALGTLPVLFAVGLGSSYAQNHNFNWFKKIIGVIIVFFALYSFNSGLVLAGANFTINFWSWSTQQVVSAEVTPNKNSDNQGVQVVKMDIDYTFQQTEFRIKKGVPVRWEINPIRVTGCTDEVVIPRLGLSTGKIRSSDIKVIEFTPTETGTIPFSCWMGMQGGKFIVE